MSGKKTTPFTHPTPPPFLSKGGKKKKERELAFINANEKMSGNVPVMSNTRCKIKKRKERKDQSNEQISHTDTKRLFNFQFIFFFLFFFFLKNPKIRSARHSSVRHRARNQQELNMIGRFGTSREAPTPQTQARTNTSTLKHNTQSEWQTHTGFCGKHRRYWPKRWPTGLLTLC